MLACSDLLEMGAIPVLVLSHFYFIESPEVWEGAGLWWVGGGRGGGQAYIVFPFSLGSQSFPEIWVASFCPPHRRGTKRAE